MRRRTSMPSMPGSSQSNKTRSGGLAPSSSLTASLPLPTPANSRPQSFRKSPSLCLSRYESSTNRIFIGDEPLGPNVVRIGYHIQGDRKNQAITKGHVLQVGGTSGNRCGRIDQDFSATRYTTRRLSSANAPRLGTNSNEFQSSFATVVENR